MRRLLKLEALIPAVRQALIDLSAGRVVQPLRLVVELPEKGGFFLAKPAIVGDILATKLLTSIPSNRARGLPALLSTVLLMDARTGETRAVMDGAWLTALRTAAASAVAADALAAGGPVVVAILGSGVQARSHALAIRAVRSTKELRIWGRSPNNVAACAQEIDGRTCKSAEEAVQGADIVCTVTSATEPVLKGAWLKRGAFVAAVGAPRPGSRELDDVAMANTVVADSREAALAESGDVILSKARIYAEIGEILGGTKPPPPAGSTVIFKSLGQAVEDAVAARLVCNAAIVL